MHFLAPVLALLAAASGALSQGIGEGTWYNTGLGACGIVNTDADMIVAIPFAIFNNFPGATANPNLNPICKKTLIATYQGKNVTVAITDKCYSCVGNDLDFSPAAFKLLADPAIGRIKGVEWHYL